MSESEHKCANHDDDDNGDRWICLCAAATDGSAQYQLIRRRKMSEIRVAARPLASASSKQRQFWGDNNNNNNQHQPAAAERKFTVS
jgi:phage/plasmid primase-like uncharacterized protein